MKMPSFEMLLRHWYFLALPIVGMALALAFVMLQGDSYRATAELLVDAKSSGLTAITLPTRPGTSLAQSSDGIRIVGLGSTAQAAEQSVQIMADLLISGPELPPGDEQAEAEAEAGESAKEKQDRLQLEKLGQDIATLQAYADVLRAPSQRGTLASLPVTDLSANASALVDVLSMLDDRQAKADLIEARLRDPVPPQDVVISTTTLPLSLQPAIFSGMLGGIFAAFTVSALLAVRRKVPAWA
ncbi:MAG: hypothetical protein ACK4G5_10695 [Devosia sp.]